jgi:hypothetical protein
MIPIQIRILFHKVDDHGRRCTKREVYQTKLQSLFLQLERETQTRPEPFAAFDVSNNALPCNPKMFPDNKEMFDNPTSKLLHGKHPLR